jgi:putative RecB family exonuclease
MNQIRLSPSRIGDYQNCPQLYKYRAIDQLPEKISLDAERGTLVHSILEHIHELGRVERNLKVAQSLAPKLWNSQKAEKPELESLVIDDGEWLDRVSALLKNYFELEDPTIFDSTHREIHLEHTPNESLHFHGYVDRLDIAPTGEIRIVDYKTGKAPKPGWEDKAIFQLRFYALLWWRQNGTIPKLLQLIYLGDKQVLKDVPSESKLLSAEKSALKIGNAISNSIKDNIWPTNPTKLCNWCSFKDICPAFTN